MLLSPDWRGPLVVNAVVAPAMALGLAWRRTQPLLALSGVVGGLVLLSSAFGSSQTWTNVFLIVVAVYSAAAHESRPLVVVAITAVGVGVVTLQDPSIATFGDAVWSSSLTGLTFLAGLGGRSLQARSAALEDRTDALDREEEVRAAAAAAQERQRIARELHDIISHSLGVLVLQAGAAEQVIERDPERARQVLRSIRSTGQEAIGEMGTLLGLIRGEAEASREPQPCLGDIARLVTTTREAGLVVDLVEVGEPRAMPNALELSAFRVVQEGLTNALQHASGASVVVTLRFDEGQMEILVVDDGEGHDRGRGGGRGLAGLRERVTIFGGRFEAGPDDVGGWRLRAVFPLAR